MMLPLSGGGRENATSKCLHLLHPFPLKTVPDFMVREKSCGNSSQVFSHDCGNRLFSDVERVFVAICLYRAWH